MGRAVAKKNCETIIKRAPYLGPVSNYVAELCFLLVCRPNPPCSGVWSTPLSRRTLEVTPLCSPPLIIRSDYIG